MFLLIAYGLMLVLVGLAGIVAARWELTTLFRLDMTAIGPGEATFLNQYRFLKAVELGAGFFCLMLRGSIIEGGAAGRVFVLLVAGGVVARSLAWIADGRPSWPFILFLALETLVLCVFLLHLGRRSES